MRSDAIAMAAASRISSRDTPLSSTMRVPALGVEIGDEGVEALGVVRDEVVREQLAAARRDPPPASLS